ncbi:MAG: hypothetical protein WC919_02125 [Candidatus Paceibacterota bacterium]|jgi:hypothetical protein
MQYVIDKDLVVAILPDEAQGILKKYPECVGVIISREIKQPYSWCVPFQDPRNDEEKRLEYRDRRRQEYPLIQDQLDMIYWDQVNGTTTFRDSISAIKAKYPKVT